MKPTHLIRHIRDARWHRNLLVASVIVSLTGCAPGFTVNDGVEDLSSLSPQGEVPVPPAGVSFKYQCSDQSTRGAGENKMRRLSKREVVDTLTVLLGQEVISNAEIQTQLGLMSSDKIQGSVMDVAESHSSSHFDAMLAISTTASELVFTKPALRDAVFGACSGQSSVTEECARNFIKSFGLKALRRPVSDAETASMVAEFKAAGGAEGLKRVLMRLMLAPELAFHVEIGSRTLGNRLRLTDYEIASRLSYRLVGLPPDAELLTAAGKGELQDLVNVKKHAQRLVMTSASSKSRISDFFSFYLQLEKVPEPPAYVGQERKISVTGLKGEFVKEIQDYIDHITWAKKGSFLDLMTSQEVFPRSERMATILGTTVATGMTPTMATKAHAGLLLRPGILAGSNVRTNPMHRGVFVRKRLLCETMGAPDPNLIDARAKEVGDISHLSTRDGYHALTSGKTCLGCHATINPAGFALEGYDQLGMPRKMETVFDETGAVKSTFAVNTVVQNPLLGPKAPMTLNGGEDLASALANGDGARACFAKMIFEYQRLRLATQEDHCAMREIESRSTADGTVLEAFVASVANEDIFWRGL